MKTINKPLAMTLFLLVIAFPVCGLAAYKAYPGPKLPKDQVAIIEGEGIIGILSPLKSVAILSIDGVELPRLRSSAIAVKPGKHTAAVRSAIFYGPYSTPLWDLGPIRTITFDAEAGHKYIVKFGSFSVEDMSTLPKAAARADLDEIKRYMAQGADVNAKDTDGKTALHAAASGVHKSPELAFTSAPEVSFTAVVEYLIAQGADVNAKDTGGNTPLHEAASNGDREVAQLFITKGADVNARNEDGATPLHMAASQGDRVLAKLLITKGADVNGKDNAGWTPLHMAASQGHRALAKLLITKGADINAKAEYGRTALELATGHKRLIKLLKRHGAKE